MKLTEHRLPNSRKSLTCPKPGVLSIMLRFFLIVSALPPVDHKVKLSNASARKHALGCSKWACIAVKDELLLVTTFAVLIILCRIQECLSDISSMLVPCHIRNIFGEGAVTGLTHEVYGTFAPGLFSQITGLINTSN